MTLRATALLLMSALIAGSAAHAAEPIGRRGEGSWQVERDELCTIGAPGGSGCSDVWAAGGRIELRRRARFPKGAC